METNTRPNQTGCKPPVAVVTINSRHRVRRSRSRIERNSRSKDAQKKSRRRSQERQLLMDVAVGSTVTNVKGVLVFFSALLLHSVVYFSNHNYLRSYHLRRTSQSRLHIPSGLEEGHRRSLSLNLGGGDCLWQPPVIDVPTNIDFFKTLLVGYPSGDKRLAFMQMEALTGWPAKDEWDFEYLGNSNHPFIKANYPHHEGIWGWGENADQVVMVVKNMRTSIVEYHDILWDIGYAQSWAESSLHFDKLYGERPPLDDFYEWRDKRVVDEVHWYGWFIDFWMEGGLYRDVFSHRITTSEHFDMFQQSHLYLRKELDYNRVVGENTVVTPTYDPHCTNHDVSGGGKPVAIISVEKLLDYTQGPNETALIAEVLMTSPKMSHYVIEKEAWNCIWDELICQKQGGKTVVDRPDGEYNEHDINFSAYMLEEMLHELDRMIAKYSSDEWNKLITANKLVELFVWHRSLIQTELDEVNSGRRRLTTRDFLGPKEREKRRLANQAATGTSSNETPRKPNTDYFDLMAKERMIQKRRSARKEQRMKERKAERKRE